MAQKLKFGNGTWATKKGSTLAYNDENNNYKPLPFTTTRNSIATRVNKQGLIEVVGNDVPRIDYTDSTEGALLLENSATNLITYSEDLSVLSKVSTGTASSPSTTANYAIAPDGTMTATRVVFDLNGGTTINDRSILRQSISTGSYYASIYVKSTNGTEQKVMWHDGSEFNITTVTNEWKRITYDTRDNISYVGISLDGDANLDVSDILVWGFQVENGNVASSYIPTNGSSATRQADTASGSGNSEVFNDSEGVLFANISAFVGAGGGTRRIEVSNSVNASQYVRLQIANGDGSLYGTVDNGSRQFIFNATSFDATLSNRISLKYKQNDFSLFLNGFEVGSSNVGSTFANGVLTQVNFSSTASEFYGKTKEIAYYDTALTDAELEVLTSYETLTELVTELNLNEL